VSRLYSKKQCFYYVFVVVSWEDMLWMMMYFPFFSSGGERERKEVGSKDNFFFCRIMVVCVIPWNPSIVLLASCLGNGT